MKTVGIICEYNPFHNGHLYHLEKIKEMYPDACIVLVLSSYFQQRGEISTMTKWDKTKVALNHNVDLVIELPFLFATQSADIFAKGAIQILNTLNVDYLVFGSESNDVSYLENLADIQINSQEYNNYVKKYLDDGLNYPTAMSKALLHFSDKKINKPNDLLALSYIKEIKKTNSKMKPISILRTNDYHKFSGNSITSASSIRTLMKENKDISNYVPNDVLNYINPLFTEDLFSFLKYKILTCKDLNIYQTVDEGLKTRILSSIKDSSSLEEFIMKVKTKRYTYNKIMRMCIHILCDLTKEECNNLNNISYLRILGFSNKGQLFLKENKNSKIPIVTHLKDDDPIMNIEIRSTSIYNLIYKKENLILKEYNQSPIKI